MGETSLSKRYFSKLFTNLIGLVIGLATSAIIPRALGPSQYGDFEFLTNFFSQLIPFLTFSTSIAFYTKLSQRQNEFKLITFYSYINFFAVCILFLFVYFLIFFNKIEILLPGQELIYVYLAILFSVFAWIANSVNQITDALGITISSEIVKVFQKIVTLIVLLYLYIFLKVNLLSFFYYQIGGSILLICLFVFIIIKFKKGSKFDYFLNLGELKFYFNEFYKYSKPLFVYSLFGVFIGIIDRWLLQKYSGSIQQGFYGFSLKIGAISFAFTSAMTALIMRDFSVAHSSLDTRRMRDLFQRYIPMLYSTAAIISSFAIVNSSHITYFFGGQKFTDAKLTIVIMALYPIHQTYGQLSGSIFFATGQTKLYRNIGIFFMALSIPFIYFVLAPKAQWGFNLGANGLAIKMVVIQFLAVNTQLYYNSKYLKVNFYFFFFHQIISLFVFLTVAYLTNLIIDDNINIYANLVLNALLYSLGILLITILFPSILGLKSEDLKKVFNYIKFIKL